MIDTERPKEVKVGMTLIVIGILIIVGGIGAYFIEKAYCAATEYACGILGAWGGMGLFGLIFLGLLFIIVGYSYRRRIRRHKCPYCRVFMKYVEERSTYECPNC